MKEYEITVQVTVCVKAHSEQEAEELARYWCGVTSNAPDEIEFITADL